jgi:hypothetical protein
MHFPASPIAPAHEHTAYDGCPEQPDVQWNNDLFNDDLYEKDRQTEVHSAAPFAHSTSSLPAFGIGDILESHIGTNQNSASLAWDGSGVGTCIDGYDPNLFPCDIDASGLFDQSYAQTWPYPATLDASIGPVDDTNEFSRKLQNENSDVMTSNQPALIPLQLLEGPRSREKTFQQPMTTLAPKSKRTRISKAAKKILDEYFSSNPYPDEKETFHLAKATDLGSRIIKTWFSNTRSRRKGFTRKSMRNIILACE